MKTWLILLAVGVVVLSVTCFLQWLYIKALEQSIQAVRSELRWTCKACDNTEYIYKALE